MAEQPKTAAPDKAEAPPADVTRERPPMFSPTGWIVILGIMVIEFVVVNFVGKMTQHKDASEPGALGDSIEYMEIDPPFNVTLADPNGLFHQVNTKIALGMDAKYFGEKADAEEKKKITSRLPKIKDEINRVIQDQKWPDVASPEGQKRLRSDIMTRMQQILPGRVREVCLESFTPQ